MNEEKNDTVQRANSPLKGSEKSENRGYHTKFCKKKKIARGKAHTSKNVLSKCHFFFSA